MFVVIMCQEEKKSEKFENYTFCSMKGKTSSIRQNSINAKPSNMGYPWDEIYSFSHEGVLY